MSKVLKTVNGEMLMNTFLPPIEFAVENLIPQGLHIEYRELELNFNSSNKSWELVSDSAENPEMLLEDITATVVRFMQNEKSFSGTPAELAERLSKYIDEEISPIVLSKRLNQNIPELKEFGIAYQSKRSNGKRIILLSRVPQNPNDVAVNSADSDGNSYIPITVPADPVE